MHSFYLDAIRKFEGYTSQASWDYAQFTNGYGTRARFAGEVISPAEADRRFRSEVQNARQIVERTAPEADEGTKAALTSLTFNAGTAWVSSGLGDAVRRGDLDTARSLFLQYNKAGGEVLPGLVSRRAQEALWIGNPEAASAANAARLSPAVAGAIDAAQQSAATAASHPASVVRMTSASVDARTRPLGAGQQTLEMLLKAAAASQDSERPGSAAARAVTADSRVADADITKSVMEGKASAYANLAQVFGLEQAASLRRDPDRGGGVTGA